MYEENDSMTNQNHTYASEPMINFFSQRKLGHITAKWIAQCENEWLSNQAHFIEFFKAIQEREATDLIFTVNSNTQTLKKITKDMNIMKKTVMNKTSITSFTSFKNVLLRVFSKLTSSFKQHEIIVKVKRNQTNFLKEKEEKKLIKNFNLAAERSGVKNINIKAVNKLSSENLAIQTRNMKKTRKLKNNKIWITSLYKKKLKRYQKFILC